MLCLALHGHTHGLWLPQMIWAQGPNFLNAIETGESLGLAFLPWWSIALPKTTTTYCVSTAPGQAVSSAASRCCQVT